MNNSRLKIITGSDTGNTEQIARDLHHMIDAPLNVDVEIVKVHQIKPEDWTSHDFYILGCPTWFDGECSQDWNWYLEEFGGIDFEGKKVAIYGLGDQEGYPDYYCDAIGILAKIVLHNGGEIVGQTSIEGHDFNYSQGRQEDTDMFYGLALDEDNQPHLTHERLEQWVKNISNYF